MSSTDSRYNLLFNVLAKVEPRRHHRLYWVLPVLVIILYILAMTAFLVLQNDQQENLFFNTEVNELRQQLLQFFLATLSVTIVLSLVTLGYLAHVRTSAEHKLALETAFRRAMENSMSTGMRVMDMTGQIVYVNPAFCRLFGWNESDLIGTNSPYPYWVPEHFKEHQLALENLLQGKSPSTGFEIEARRRDGELFTARMYVSPLRDRNGRQIGWITSVTDVTESKRIQEALTLSQERFLTVLENLNDAISVVVDTPNGLVLLFANRTYRHLFGADINGHLEIYKAYQRHPTDNEVIYAPSVSCWFEVQHRSLTWTDGHRARMQVARDITQRRKYELELATQQEKIQLNSRLTTMGEMASSLAHELNQPLTAIMNYNKVIHSLLSKDNYKKDSLLQTLDKSIQQTARAGKIISRIREFVKRNEPRYQSVQVASIIDHTLDLAVIEGRKYGISIELNLPDDLPDVRADPILIEQVLFNLIKNGMEAMRDSTRNQLIVNVMQLENNIQISVIDFGHGIKDPVRLFEPFFSTKEEGLGMGLNICRTIIEAHHGQLWAENNPAGGSIFYFKLPCINPHDLLGHA